MINVSEIAKLNDKTSLSVARNNLQQHLAVRASSKMKSSVAAQFGANPSPKS